MVAAVAGTGNSVRSQTSLIPVPKNAVPANPYATPDVIDTMAKGADFLPRLDLIHAKKEGAGVIPLNHWGLVEGKDQVTDLTSEVVVIPIAWRPKAVKFGKGGAKTIARFNPKDPEFIEIVETAKANPQSGRVYGLEFLVWLPSVKRFGLYHANNASARTESKKLVERQQAGQAARLSSQPLQNEKAKWVAPLVQSYSTPIPPDSLPKEEDVIRELRKFNSPPSHTEEVPAGAEPAPAATRER